MNEAFLQFVWQYRLFYADNMYSTKGDKIEVLDVGKLNTDGGADFFDARIKINDMLWAGNVEIHTKSSLWYAHQHHTDKAYDNVILHVVAIDDRDVLMDNNQLLPCVELKYHNSLWHNFAALKNSQKWIPCYDDICKVPRFFISHWLERMLIERLETKANTLSQLLKQNQKEWNETFYQLLVRYFGLRVNAEPFQQLAQIVPSKILARQKNNLLQLEALLFGQAGMLNHTKCIDTYYLKLQSEYQFLADKYHLKPMPESRWKLLRLRPANFPTIRIAQLAKLIHQSSALFSKILACEHLADVMPFFKVELSGYWKNHYLFGKLSTARTKSLGKNAIHLLIINAVVPFIFLYGEYQHQPHLKERVLGWLNQIPAENNSIISNWKKCGVAVKSAADTQALLQLKSSYCNNHRCLECEFGNRIIRQG